MEGYENLQTQLAHTQKRCVSMGAGAISCPYQLFPETFESPPDKASSSHLCDQIADAVDKRVI